MLLGLLFQQIYCQIKKLVRHHFFKVDSETPSKVIGIKKNLPSWKEPIQNAICLQERSLPIQRQCASERNIYLQEATLGVFLWM